MLGDMKPVKNALLGLLLVAVQAGTMVLSGCLLIEPPPPRAHPRDVVVDEALAQVDRPYRQQGADPTGFDTSGLVHYIFQRSGFVLPDSSAGQRAQGVPVNANQVQRGDLLFYRLDDSPYQELHVGVYVGRDRMVHIRENGRVQIELVNVPYWQRRLVDRVRYLP